MLVSIVKLGEQNLALRMQKKDDLVIKPNIFLLFKSSIWSKPQETS